MGEGGRISWGRLILGATLALAMASVLMTLFGPLAFSLLTGGANLQIQNDFMAPAMEPGDWVLAEALLPGQVPRRGSIVIYEVPRGRGTSQALRVVGLPGERIQIRGGALYINGRRAEMERLEDRVVGKRPPGRRAAMPICINDPVRVDGECRQEQWRETTPNGTSAIVLNTRRKIGLAAFSGTRTGGGGGDDTGVFVVPGGQVFLIGDNRDAALDSRSLRHGMVPIHKLKSRVYMIHTSLDLSARFLSPRWDRFFKRLE